MSEAVVVAPVVAESDAPDAPYKGNNPAKPSADHERSEEGGAHEGEESHAAKPKRRTQHRKKNHAPAVKHEGEVSADNVELKEAEGEKKTHKPRRQHQKKKGSTEAAPESSEPRAPSKNHKGRALHSKPRVPRAKPHVLLIEEGSENSTVADLYSSQKEAEIFRRFSQGSLFFFDRDQNEISASVVSTVVNHVTHVYFGSKHAHVLLEKVTFRSPKDQHKVVDNAVAGEESKTDVDTA